MTDFSHIQANIKKFRAQTDEFSCQLVAVSKTYSVEAIEQAYQAGQRIFGENRVQELCQKKQNLPEDIEWHLIGHLQTNKVAQVIGQAALIHGVDSLKLLKEIDKQAGKAGHIASCLLQIHIAQEETKFGFLPEELLVFLRSRELEKFTNLKVCGLMGMASYTPDTVQIRNEFTNLKSLFDQVSAEANLLPNPESFQTLSMGMSGDYAIAMQQGSTMIRIGSAIFGVRDV